MDSKSLIRIRGVKNENRIDNFSASTMLSLFSLHCASTN